MSCNTHTQTTRRATHRDRAVRRSPRRGFSFIEVMVVVVIIGMLAGAVAMRFTGVMDKARINRAKNDISTIINAVEMYYLSHSRYPDIDEGLDTLNLKTKTDPWGQPYQYNKPGTDPAGREPFEVYSFGADQREGGEGVNADIFSWQLADVENED